MILDNITLHYIGMYELEIDLEESLFKKYDTELLKEGGFNRVLVEKYAGDGLEMFVAYNWAAKHVDRQVSAVGDGASYGRRDVSHRMRCSIVETIEQNYAGQYDINDVIKDQEGNDIALIVPD